MSNINPTNIDGTYPVAGQDNDSQGFRDNFTNTRNNFAFAKSEIEDLAAKAVLKSALVGTTLTNNMNGSLMYAASIRDFREVRYDLGETSGTILLDHVNGHYQTITLTDDVVLEFNWPTTGFLGRIRLEAEILNTDYTITVPGTVTIGTSGIAGLRDNVITFSETGVYTFEFTTENNGTNIGINDLTRARDYIPSSRLRIRQATPASVGNTGDQAGMIAVDDNNIYICDGAYDGITPIWRAIKAGTGSVSLNDAVGTSVSSLSTITGLTFSATPGVRYRFEALIPFSHSTSTTSTHTFSVQFSAGTCNYLVEQQTGPATDFSRYASTTSDDTGAVATTESTSMRFAKISGTFTHSEVTNITLALRFATSAGTLSALAGSNLKWERVN